MILEYLRETSAWLSSLMQLDGTDKYLMYDGCLDPNLFEYTKPRDYPKRKTGLLIPEKLL
jgi:hypothetical protein